MQRTSTLAKRLLARKKYPANVNHSCFGIKLNSIPLKDQNLLLLTWFQHLIPRHLESGTFHLTQSCQLPLGSDHRERTWGPPSRAAWPSCGTGGARPSGRPRPRDTSHGEAARLTGRPQPSFFSVQASKTEEKSYFAGGCVRAISHRANLTDRLDLRGLSQGGSDTKAPNSAPPTPIWD